MCVCFEFGVVWVCFGGFDDLLRCGLVWCGFCFGCLIVCGFDFGFGGEPMLLSFMAGIWLLRMLSGFVALGLDFVGFGFAVWLVVLFLPF